VEPRRKQSNPGVIKMNATELLKRDHEAVRKMFDEYEAAGESAEDRAEIVEDLTEALLIHSVIEEEIFYPAIGESGAEDAESQVADALDAHDELKALLNELFEMEPDDEPAFTEKVMELKNHFERHVAEEEGPIFADAETLGEDNLAALGDDMESRKEELAEEGVDLDEEDDDADTE
jgi:hemerythrin-like domain-containing protein